MPRSKSKEVTITITKEQIIGAVQKMARLERDAFIEDLLASTSSEYLASIREARADRRRGRTAVVAPHTSC